MPVHVKCQRMRHILILIKAVFLSNIKANVYVKLYLACNQSETIHNYDSITKLDNIVDTCNYHFWIVPADDTSIEPLNT